MDPHAGHSYDQQLMRAAEKQRLEQIDLLKEIRDLLRAARSNVIPVMKGDSKWKKRVGG